MGLEGIKAESTMYVIPKGEGALCAVIDFMGTFLGTLHVTAEVNSDVIPIIL